MRFELGGGPGRPGYARVEESACRLLAFHVVALRARVRDELHVPDGRGDYGANQSGGGHATRRNQTHSEVIRAHQSSGGRCAARTSVMMGSVAIRGAARTSVMMGEASRHQSQSVAISRNQSQSGAYERDDGRSEPPSPPPPSPPPPPPLLLASASMLLPLLLLRLPPTPERCNQLLLLLPSTVFSHAPSRAPRSSPLLRRSRSVGLLPGALPGELGRDDAPRRSIECKSM